MNDFVTQLKHVWLVTDTADAWPLGDSTDENVAGDSLNRMSDLLSEYGTE